MANELVVKDNALINASYNLDTIEQRLVLLAIVRARATGQGINADTVLRIHAKDYMQQFNVEKHAAYEALKNSAKNLFGRQFGYVETDPITNKKKIIHSRWVSQIAYIDDAATVEVIFTPAVVPLITRLEERFTSYQLKQVSQLTSKYAIRLYELIIQWREVGRTPIFEMLDLRSKLGLTEEDYPRTDTFKVKVIEAGLKQINKLTDITANYEQQKTGRTITGFLFKFTSKSVEECVEEKEIILTEKQVLWFAHKLAHDEKFTAVYAKVGESYEDLEKRLVVLLAQPQNIEKWLEDLKRVGYRMKK